MYLSNIIILIPSLSRYHLFIFRCFHLGVSLRFKDIASIIKNIVAYFHFRKDFLFARISTIIGTSCCFAITLLSLLPGSHQWIYYHSVNTHNRLNYGNNKHNVQISVSAGANGGTVLNNICQLQLILRASRVITQRNIFMQFWSTMETNATVREAAANRIAQKIIHKKLLRISWLSLKIILADIQ